MLFNGDTEKQPATKWRLGSRHFLFFEFDACQAYEAVDAAASSSFFA